MRHDVPVSASSVNSIRIGIENVLIVATMAKKNSTCAEFRQIRLSVWWKHFLVYHEPKTGTKTEICAVVFGVGGVEPNECH